MVQAWRLFRLTMRQKLEALVEKQHRDNLDWEERMTAKGFSKAAIEKVKSEREKEQQKERAEQKKLADMGQLEFIRQVVEVSLKTHATKRPSHPATHAKLTAASLESIRYDEGNHLIKLTKITGVCKQCKGRTKFRCTRCDVALHAEHCFYRFHGGEESDDE